MKNKEFKNVGGGATPLGQRAAGPAQQEVGENLTVHEVNMGFDRIGLVKILRYYDTKAVRSNCRVSKPDLQYVILNLFQDLKHPPTLTLPLKGGRENLVGRHYYADRKYTKTIDTINKRNYNSNMMNYKSGILRKNRTFFTKSKILEKVVKQVQDDKLVSEAHSKHLVPYCLSNLVSSKKAAFTLAEVLITLGIIGIVAAMTIPTLISKYQKKQTVTALKKAYSTVQQAILMSQNVNGPVERWDTSLNGKEFFAKYFADYIVSSKNFTSAELWDVAPRYHLNGSDYSGTTYAPVSTRATHFVLSDGSLISANLNGVGEGGLWIGIDVNGTKEPNTVGKDTFLFFMSSFLKY